MATLNVKLVFTSSDVSSDALDLTHTDALTVGAPSVGISRLTLVGDASASTIFENNTTTTYVYLKNTDATNHIKYFNDTDDGFGILFPGEANFFAVIDNEGLKVQANTGNCVLEYAYWTKA
jgi:hypothetical protein